MVQVVVPSMLAAQAEGRRSFDVDADTTGDALHALPVADLLFNERGELNRHVNVYVDGLDHRAPRPVVRPRDDAADGLGVALQDGLHGAWGGGAKMYRAGPFSKGKPGQGYQLPLTPREFFAAGVVAINGWTRKAYGKDFDRLPLKEREAALKELEAGKAALDDFDGKQFFEALLQITMEGFFADPIYGGNRNKVAWKMMGFPGLPATYANAIETYRGRRYEAEPQSIADFS